MKAQGSLEYLLILAAILAIAVVVVLVANAMLGTPGKSNVINEDKYKFAVNGWGIKGYHKPLEEDDFNSGNAPIFVKNDKEYNYSSDPPETDDVLIGTLTGTNTTYNVYVDDSGSYHVKTPPEPENPLYSDASLIAYWKFEDNANDETGTNDGVVYGATYSTSGKIGGAYEFDGKNDNITIPNSISLNPKYITITAWFNPAVGSLNSQKCIIQKPYTSHISPYYQYSICLKDFGGYDKYIWFYVATGQGTLGLIEADVPNSGFEYGQWNFIATTYNGTYLGVYLNGKKLHATLYMGDKKIEGALFDPATISAYDTVLGIAGYPNLADIPKYQYGGLIDEVAIFNRALTSAEILSLYKGG